MSERFPTDDELQTAWQDYLFAKARAEHTGKLSDGLVAGRMWRRFVYLFADPERAFQDTTVVPLSEARARKAAARQIRGKSL